MKYYSPVWAPSYVARCKILITSGLLDKYVNLLFEVFLLAIRTCNDLLTSSDCIFVRLWVDLYGLVWIMEFQASQFILDTLDDDLCDLVQLVLSGIFVCLLLHELMELVVFNAS